MKKLVLIAAIALTSPLTIRRPSVVPPFTIDASENVADEFPGAPRLQSFSFAQWNGRWVFIGGRVGGYHAAGGRSAEFLRADSNRAVWVIDTTVMPARTYHVDLDQLPQRLLPVRAQWASTGQLYFQDGDQLYICGGYGQDDTGKWATFDVVSRVRVPDLIEGVMRGRIPAESIEYGRSPLVQSTGGALMKLADGPFYLVMGHVFNGSYTTFEGQGERNDNEASQVYLNEIRKLRIASGPEGVLKVDLVEAFRDESEFHRRDLNVASLLSPAGLGFGVYGGVFTPDTQLSYSKPVYVSSASQPAIDGRFDQKMNAYTCAILLMYGDTARTMYTTFFGGIGRYTWDAGTREFVENRRTGSKSDAIYMDGLQWSDQISTIQNSEGESLETVQPHSLPGFIGSGSIFIPSSAVARARPGTDILALDALPMGGKVFVGYVYGGIRAYPYQFPYLKTSPPYNSGAVPSVTTDMILKVYVSR